MLRFLRECLLEVYICTFQLLFEVLKQGHMLLLHSIINLFVIEHLKGLLSVVRLLLLPIKVLFSSIFQFRMALYR